MAKENQFTNKVRTFHPSTTVWVQNVLDHDIVYKVADEFNRQFEYRLPKGKVSELPGGKVAELGVKHIVNEIIQNERQHARMHEAGYRSKIEDRVILKIKEAPEPKPEELKSGVIDLSVGDKPADKEESKKELEVEKVNPAFTPPKPEVKSGLDTVAKASVAGLPATDVGVKDE